MSVLNLFIFRTKQKRVTIYYKDQNETTIMRKLLHTNQILTHPSAPLDAFGCVSIMHPPSDIRRVILYKPTYLSR